MLNTQEPNFMQETKFMEQQELRERCIERLEVLDRVKKLFLLPEMEVATTKMIADYFEVDIETIKKVYQRNENEISEDGAI